MYRVLIADREPLVRAALDKIVGALEDFETALCVDTGDKAVAACNEESLDLAFLSLSLSGCPGLEAARRIGARSPSLPLVLIADRDNFDFARETLRLNISGYVTKPLSRKAIRQILLDHKACHASQPPELAEVLLAALANRDFMGAYAAIPQTGEKIRALAGPDPARRHEILALVGQRLLDALDRYEGLNDIPVPLPVFEPDMLAADAGIDLGLFHTLDHAFRRNCVKSYPVLAHAFNFIERNITEKIGLEDIVLHCAASQTHISKIFKKHFSLSVMDYLHLRKLHLAKRLFVYSGQSASGAAFALGYNEAGYFSKVFKKYEGMTVQRYKALQAGPGAV